MNGDGFQSSFTRLVWWLFRATRGGPMRGRILRSIMDEPRNANQLSREVGVNYRTIEHHLNVLMENGLITSQGEGYGKIYFLSPTASGNIEIIERVFDETFRKSERK